MGWLLIALIVAGFGILARIYFKVRNLQAGARDDWDAQIIAQLRKAGSDPFRAHEVDFFFALPDEGAAHVLNAQLEQEGYAVDLKVAAQSGDLPLSLHARRAMRLSVPDMQALSRRFAQLAHERGGRYDGWAADVVK